MTVTSILSLSPFKGQMLVEMHSRRGNRTLYTFLSPEVVCRSYRMWSSHSPLQHLSHPWFIDEAFAPCPVTPGFLICSGKHTLVTSFWAEALLCYLCKRKEVFFESLWRSRLLAIVNDSVLQRQTLSKSNSTTIQHKSELPPSQWPVALEQAPDAPTWVQF